VRWNTVAVSAFLKAKPEPKKPKNQQSNGLSKLPLLRFLASALSRLFPPHQEFNDAHNPNDPTNKTTQRREIFTETPIRVAIDSIPSPEPPTDQQKADKKKKKRRRKLKTGLQVAATLSALVLLVINARLLKSTRDANVIAKTSFETGQRPYITVARKDGTVAEFRGRTKQRGPTRRSHLFRKFWTSAH
jgi:hypothetical protein